MKTKTQWGLYFQLNEDDFTASIISSSNAYKFLTIPRSVNYQSNDYIIRSINSNAFKNNKIVKTIDFSEDSELLLIDRDSFFKSSIESINLPSSLKELREGWCSFTPKLKRVTISSKNKNFSSIENNNFLVGKSDEKSDEFDLLLFANRGIEHVTIPSSIRCICASSFYDCKKIKTFNFSIDSKLRSINDSAFYNSSLKSVTFPPSLEELNEGWCKKLNKLKSISFSQPNKNFTVVENKFLLGKSDKKGENFDLLLFVYRDIQKVVIPSYIKYIGPYALYDCIKLESLTFSDDSELKSIGLNSFSYSSIEKVSFPSTLEEIGKLAFKQSLLKSVEFPADSKLRTIHKEAFLGTRIEKVIIPARVRKIGSSAFYFCHFLSTFKFEDNSQLETIGKSAFYFNTFESFEFPSNLKKIGKDAFLNCFNLKSTGNEYFRIPSNVQEIGEAAFCGCGSIQSIEIPENSELQSFEPNIFFESKIQCISIPSKLKELKDGWCSKVFRLRRISVLNNERFKFVDDTFLVGKSDEKSDIYDVLYFVRYDIKEAILPSYIQIIRPKSFSNCCQLESVKFSVDSKLRIIEKEAFSCSTVKSISLPSSLEYIGESAFEKCDNLTSISNYENTQVRTIESRTFSMTKIECLSIPSNISELKESWCELMTSLKEVKVSSNNKFYKYINDSFLVGKKDKSSDVFNVLLFANRDIKCAVIPSFIEVISHHAFSECKNIEKIEFSENSKLKEIQKFAFKDSSIKSIVIPSSVIKIDDFAFGNCYLKKIELESNSKLSEIGNKAFINNSITSIVLPPNVSHIAECAFYNNQNLETSEFLGEFLTIEYSIFDFTSLSLLSFPNAKKVCNFKNFIYGLAYTVHLFIPNDALLD